MRKRGWKSPNVFKSTNLIYIFPIFVALFHFSIATIRLSQISNKIEINPGDYIINHFTIVINNILSLYCCHSFSP